MMAQKVKLEPALARRLASLTGEDPACCAADLFSDAKEVRRSAEFDIALVRAKALADEARLLAVALIARRGEMCGCELQAALGLTHATISHHMRVLTAAGVVTSRREGKWTYYAVEPSAVAIEIPR